MEGSWAEVTCPVCLEPYREPKSLVCGHSLCVNCVTGQMLHAYSMPSRGLGGRFTSAICCPLCRVETKIPPTGLPTNFALSDLLRQFDALNTRESMVCYICQNRYRDENFYFCANCSRSVDQPTLLKNPMCSTCAIDNHNGGGHALFKLLNLKQQNLSTAQTKQTVREELEEELNRMQCANDQISVDMRNSLETLRQKLSLGFDAVGKQLSDDAIHDEAYLKDVVNGIEHLRRHFCQLFLRTRQVQQQSMDNWKSCMDQLLNGELEAAGGPAGGDLPPSIVCLDNEEDEEDSSGDSIVHGHRMLPCTSRGEGSPNTTSPPADGNPFSLPKTTVAGRQFRRPRRSIHHHSRLSSKKPKQA